MSVTIFLLHGLGAHTATLIPLELYLLWAGFDNIHKISYPVDKMEFDEMLDYVSLEMEKIVSKDNEIIVIGQSMGGVVANNLHRKDWNIKLGIYIGSPLHGANFLNQLTNILHPKIVNLLHKKPYDFLKIKKRENEPPHQYHTISMGWFWTSFDGCVYKDEVILNERNHTHLAWADHRTIFANPRLGYHVNKIIKKNIA